MLYKQHFSREDARLIYSVFLELSNLKQSELMKLFGSMGVNEVCDLAHELRYYDYCKRHDIKVSEMDEYDYERYCEEKWENQNFL